MNQRGGQVIANFNLVLSAPKGIVYYTTDGTDPRASAQALVYTGPITLTDLTTIKTRALNGPEWSALNAATFVVGQPALVLSELHYHRAEPSATERASGFADADAFEFVELWNNGVGSYDLRGVRLTKGIQFDFSTATVTSLPSGRFALVVKNRAAFELRYGQDLPVIGEYTGQLSNSGELIELVNLRETSLLRFTYETRTPWPNSADGAGYSLEVVNPMGDLNAAANWRASQAVGGSPGVPNPSAPLTLAVVVLEPNQLRLRFEGKTSSGYTILVRDSLSSGTWQVFSRIAPPSVDQLMDVRIDLAPNPGAKFFRVSMP